MEFVYLQICFRFAKFFREFTNPLFLYLWKVLYIYKSHIYTQIVDLFTQIIMKQISLRSSASFKMKTL